MNPGLEGRVHDGLRGGTDTMGSIELLAPLRLICSPWPLQDIVLL